jgi:hypothetical protein
MTKILLISEDTIKTHSNLNDNVWGKSLTPAIITTQDIWLSQILGKSLYHRLLELVENGGIRNENFQAYKVLLDDYVQNYLIYETLANLIPEISTKITNMGLVVSNDEHVQNVTQGERDLVMGQYQKYADAYCKMLQDFLKENRNDFPELNCEAELNSAASTQLFLGGRRGRKLI